MLSYMGLISWFKKQLGLETASLVKKTAIVMLILVGVVIVYQIIIQVLTPAIETSFGIKLDLSPAALSVHIRSIWQPFGLILGDVTNLAIAGSLTVFGLLLGVISILLGGKPTDSEASGQTKFGQILARLSKYANQMAKDFRERVGK